MSHQVGIIKIILVAIMQCLDWLREDVGNVVLRIVDVLGIHVRL